MSPKLLQFFNGTDGEIKQTVEVGKFINNGGRKAEIIAIHGNSFDGIFDGNVGVGNETTKFVDGKR